MKMRHVWAICVFLLATWFGATASAQDTVAPVAEAQVGAPSWESVATRAEELLERSTASKFALNRLRAELLEWRDHFSALREQNSGRLATVDAQLDALGAAVEGEEEPSSVAERRAALTDMRAELAAPAVLAQEAFARATGLIFEIDTSIRARDTQALTERSVSPLNPTYWPGAIAAIGQNIGRFGTETVAGARADLQSGVLWRNIPLALLLLAAGGYLIVQGRRLVQDWHSRLRATSAQRATVWAMPVSFLQVVLPCLGLYLLTLAIDQIDIFGVAGVAMLDAIIWAAVIVLVSLWLTAEFFPQDGTGGPLSYPGDTCARLRRLTLWLGIGLGIFQIMQVFVANREAAEAELAVLLLPLQIWLGVLLYRFGRTLRTADIREGDTTTTGRTRGIVGLFSIIIGVVGPILAAAGYAQAANALIEPAVLTLALFGIVLLLQRFVSDVWGLRSAADNGAMIPILIGFVLFLLSVPILALIWGAQWSELIEIWDRFRAGFRIGETTLSPTDFLTFFVVFALGYAITRFLQNTLRTTVLPRTRFDLGGQNAIVSGVGYVGIMLAVIIAIVSAGIDLSSIAIVAGALSVGIGFGLQNIVSNFVSGIILLIERPVGEGDMIEVNGEVGYVRQISVRSTTIETFDRRDVIVPNADLISGQVTNWTRGNSIGRIIVPVGVAYGTDTKKVMEILMEIALAHPMVLHDPPPSVLFRAFGDSSLDFEIRAILRDVNYSISTTSEINQEISDRFAAEEIEIPFPQRDLWLRNPEAIGPQTET